jgi:cation diffusion facilitator CzcD-associated flavoprotein CzcO
VNERCHGVVIIGAGSVGQSVAAELRDAGTSDFTVVDREVIGAVFDDETDTWTLAIPGGEACRGRVVIACESPFVPWTPNLPGRNDFRGVSFHAATPDPDFDPAGQRIAVIGADAAAGQLIGRLTRSGASVKVFPLPPRRVIPPARRAKHYLRRQAELVASPIGAVTASGIRTCDGIHHDADVIVYGTGLTVADRDDTVVGARGVTLQQAWQDGMEPYLGVAVHGFPNYFTVSGPEFEAATRYVVECLQLMKGHTRIEVRRSTQQVFNERVHLRGPSGRLVASAFDLVSSISVHEDIYDGTATVTVADICREVRVRIAGHIDPIDGQYHWQGTLFGQLPGDVLARLRTVTLVVDERSVSARITEETPQGTHTIAGVGAPPFALADVEVATVPQF